MTPPLEAALIVGLVLCLTIGIPKLLFRCFPRQIEAAKASKLYFIYFVAPQGTIYARWGHIAGMIFGLFIVFLFTSFNPAPDLEELDRYTGIMTKVEKIRPRTCRTLIVLTENNEETASGYTMCNIYEELKRYEGKNITAYFRTEITPFGPRTWVSQIESEEKMLLDYAPTKKRISQSNPAKWASISIFFLLLLVFRVWYKFRHQHIRSEGENS